ncbi:MAG TPA: cytochrome c [Terracidiphilus sp.]|jgi:mono/diheme cytochrome c family protein|nr:cytochrome c [Terracidiphilus sp.]
MRITTGISLIAIMASMTMTAAFAQSSGADVYKTKCQSCHGAAGVPSAGMAKAMGVKPATDPAVKSQTEAKMIAVTTNGAGKMPAFKGKLTDAQIKDSVAFFRTFAK